MKIIKIKYIIFATLLLIVVVGIFAFVFKKPFQDKEQVQSSQNQELKAQSAQEEIIENTQKHANDFKSSSENPNERVVIITLYSREVVGRTEYALGIKYSDLKSLDVSKSELKNETSKLTRDNKSFVQQVLNNLKSGNISGLIKSTDPQIVKIIGESKLAQQYSHDSKYFQDYVSYDISGGFMAILVDDSIVLLESFINNAGEAKMFGMVLSQTSTGNFIGNIFPGETSILAAFPPEQNKTPIIVANPIKGFERRDLNEIGGNVLIPNGWHFKYELNNDTQAYFISKEEIKGVDGIFETGLTINAFNGQMIPGGDAVKYMNNYINEISKRGKIEAKNSGKEGDMMYEEITGIFDDNGFKYKENLRMIANTKTNSLYLIIFESTPEKWNTEWNTKGKAIVNYISLGSNF